MKGNIDINNYLENVRNYHTNHQPFFYDVGGLFWVWNFEEHKYEFWDDVDVMRSFDNTLGLEGKTVSHGLKSSYMEAFKWVGREHIPTNAPKKWIQFKDKAYSLKSGNIYDATPDYFFTNPIGLFVCNLAGADFFVAAAAVFERQGTDIDAGRFVDDAVPDRYHHKLLLLAVYQPDGNVLLGKQGVFNKAIAAGDIFDTAQIEHNGIAFNFSMFFDKLLECLGFFSINICPFNNHG